MDEQTTIAKAALGEYVLNRQQVAALAPVLQASRSSTYNFVHNWPASTPMSDRQMTESMVRRITHEEFTSTLREG